MRREVTPLWVRIPPAAYYKMPVTKPKPKPFAVGDRVAERPKQRTLFYKSPEGRKKVELALTQRVGTVVSLTSQKNRNGAVVPYVTVKWDGTDIVSTHANARICFLEDLNRLTEEFNPV